MSVYDLTRKHGFDRYTVFITRPPGDTEGCPRKRLVGRGGGVEHGFILHVLAFISRSFIFRGALLAGKVVRDGTGGGGVLGDITHSCDTTIVLILFAK